MRCRKIVILGPESTGKSTLCESLAHHYAPSRPSAWVPEYAREYLTTHGMDYHYEDLITIAKGQLALEENAALILCSVPGSNAPVTFGRPDLPNPAPNMSPLFPRQKEVPPNGSQNDDPVLFIDTDMYVMKVWGEFVFGRCEPWILNQIVSRHYDGYLLCSTDLPWSYDPLREYPDLENREKLFHIYKDLMVNQSSPWALVKGKHEERLADAITAVDAMLALQH
jgi:nicotinamide riboside kinase